MTQSSLALAAEQPAHPAELIGRKYAQGWLVLDEVANLPGFSGSRRLDFVVVGLWESTGHEIHGIELKVSRADWLRELKDLSKSDAMLRHVDRFFLAALPGVAKVDELPSNWGFFELKDARVRAVKAAPLLERDRSSVSRSFNACLWQAVNRITDRKAAAMASAELKRLDDEFERRVTREVARRTGHLQDQSKFVTEVLEALGMNPGGFRAMIHDSKDVARALKWLLDHRYMQNPSAFLRNCLIQYERHCNDLRALLDGSHDEPGPFSE